MADDHQESGRVSRRGFAGSLVAGLALVAAGMKGRLKLTKKSEFKEAEYYEPMSQGEDK